MRSLRRFVLAHPFAVAAAVPLATTAAIAIGRRLGALSAPPPHAALLAFAMDGRRAIELVPAEPSGPPPPPKGTWSDITAPRIWLGQGWRYRAIVSLPWYVPSAVASPDKARAYAEDKGFTDVVVTDERPAGWPDDDGDLWVEATWGRSGTYYDRPSAVVRVLVEV